MESMFLFCTLESGPALLFWLSGKSPHPKQENGRYGREKSTLKIIPFLPTMSCLNITAVMFGHFKVCRAKKHLIIPGMAEELKDISYF